MEQAVKPDAGKKAIAAGLTGVALGAVGVAAAYALADRKTRDKINDNIDVAKDKGREKVEQLKKKAREMRGKAEDMADTVESQTDDTLA